MWATLGRVVLRYAHKAYTYGKDAIWLAWKSPVARKATFSRLVSGGTSVLAAMEVMDIATAALSGGEAPVKRSEEEYRLMASQAGLDPDADASSLSVDADKISRMMATIAASGGSITPEVERLIKEALSEELSGGEPERVTQSFRVSAHSVRALIPHASALSRIFGINAAQLPRFLESLRIMMDADQSTVQDLAELAGWD